MAVIAKNPYIISLTITGEYILLANENANSTLR
jgi:hypothetical protein